MRARTSPTKLLALVAGILGVAAGTTAEAQTIPNCTAIGPNVVIIDGDSGIAPVLKGMAPGLAALSTPINIVYKSNGSCGGVQPFTDSTLLSGTAVYWDSTSTQQTCNLPPAGIKPDIGMPGVPPATCGGLTIPASGFGDWAGPVNTWAMIVPPGSSQQSISAQAQYFIYGFLPANGMVAPWTDPNQIWGRAITSGTLTAVALASHLSPARLAAAFIDPISMTATAQQQAGEPNVRDKVAAASSLGQSVMDATLGFVGGSIYDQSRNMVRVLAFQGWDQTCGYLPDSTLTAFDKANVRDGHYDLWTNFHFVANVDPTTKMPTNANVATLIGYLTDPLNAPASLNLLPSMIKTSLTPTCAMHVQRDSATPASPANGLGALMSVPASHQFCDGYFEFNATGATTHASCSTDADCTSKSISSGSTTIPTPKCHLTYCEIQ